MFDPAAVETFRFVSYDYDEATGRARFHYAFDHTHHFTEELTFPVPEQPLDGVTRKALDRALLLLHLVAGVSYYKAAVPAVAVVESGLLTDDEAAFVRDTYFHGLGEFAYVNGLTMQGKPDLRYDRMDTAEPVALSLPRRSLVAVGGGKDSCVSIETLREHEEPILLASVNRPKAIDEVMEVAGLPSVSVQRALAPELFELNTDGAYNGHVPITAVVSMTLVATALIAGCDTVVMSNERSASFGNLHYDGREINHQYSKGIDAERALARTLRQSVTPDLTYFSLLRPLSELEIARRFMRSERYDKVFTSCNRAFRIDEGRRTDHWCCRCDKCRFVFLILAPFATPQRMRDIFGDDILDDLTQEEGYDALIGWNTNKPFECVGEVEESIAALLLLASNPEWRDHAIVDRFTDQIAHQLVLPDDVMNRPFEMGHDHDVPPHYLKMLHATQ